MEWKECFVRDVSILKNGKKRPSSIGNIPVYGGNGVMDYVNDNNNEDVVLIGRVGAYCGCVHRCEGRCWVSDNAIAVNANESTDINYLFYALKNIDINYHRVGGAQPLMTQDILGGLPIRIPQGIEDQFRISSILSSLDRKIELNNKINAQLEEMAQALFKEWFVDFGPFKDGKFVESELGLIPEGWRVGTLSEYCKVKSGFAFKSSWWTDFGCPVIKIKNITDSGNLDMTDCSFVSEENTIKACDFKAQRGDLIIAMTGATIGKFNIVPRLDHVSFINQRVGKFFLGSNPLDRLPFVYCLLRHGNNREQIIGKGQGSAQPNISGTDIESLSVLLPPEETICLFNEKHKPLFDNILTNQEENRNLSQLRDTLLPKLMNGEIDLDKYND